MIFSIFSVSGFSYEVATSNLSKKLSLIQKGQVLPFLTGDLQKAQAKLLAKEMLFKQGRQT
ncbi:MAG: hypothetical protein HYT65_01345 [Candidatus Yanofskybacteria bacterium]|nr:hypothetical protein [Candidatus Yanofskybacteria bacterium]